ncbi:cytochrome c biogenesis protein [Marinibactrum halimedae]|uniref:Cytochrome c-type biogenesis protein n=2 Tax=Marinibactrum halimedae TaxID=1444977 RepID=A0AA37TEI2_9GAMM|nr:cytochrome c biogenesis protein [Marinibactrum halimedae]
MSVQAAIDVYEFKSPQDEARFERFVAELRCPKCQNQNLAGSDSQIAQDLRRELHRMINEGRDDDDIVEFMVNRYGDYVLYKPRLQDSTAMLWFGPLALFCIGFAAVMWIARKRRLAVSTHEPEAIDRSALEAMLKKDNDENSR